MTEEQKEKRREYAKKYYQKNKQKHYEKTKKWQEENKKKAYTYHKKWKTNNKDKVKDTYLKKTYGISLVDWNILFEKQGNCCAICSLTSPGRNNSWATDHDHTTNKVRGILCHDCNLGIGLFKDSASLMIYAAKYVGENNAMLG